MTETDARQGNRTCRIVGAPDAIDAGDEFSLRVEVAATPAVDLSHEEVVIFDAAGETTARVPLAALQEDADGFATVDIRLTAPAMAGSHVWTARLAAFEDDAVAYPEVTAEVTVSVEAHRIAPVVWDVPSSVAPGARFRVKIGARCSTACSSRGWQVKVTNGADRTLAEGQTGDTPWVGTDGLYYAELELAAPDEIGLLAWTATVTAPGEALPHVTGQRRFTVRTAPAADCELRVRVTDAATGRPASGLKVAVHPFSARTGADGLAEIAVSKGDHRVFISGKGYIPYAEACRIDGAHDIEIAIEPDPGLTEADIWV